MFITEAMAATEAAAPVEVSPAVGLLTQLILVFAIFYFILIRPQKKKMEEHEAMLNAIKVKDDVITSSGVYGKVTKVQDDTFMIEIAKGVEIKVLKDNIRENLSAKTIEVKK